MLHNAFEKCSVYFIVCMHRASALCGGCILEKMAERNQHRVRVWLYYKLDYQLIALHDALQIGGALNFYNKKYIPMSLRDRIFYINSYLRVLISTKTAALVRPAASFNFRRVLEGAKKQGTRMSLKDMKYILHTRKVMQESNRNTVKQYARVAKGMFRLDSVGENETTLISLLTPFTLNNLENEIILSPDTIEEQEFF